MRIPSHRHAQRGVSLVEMMIATAAGLIVIGAVLVFTVSSIRANSESVLATRLSHELRATLDTLGRELRRAGYDDDAIQSVGAGTGYASPFSAIAINGAGDCIVYALDRRGGVPGRVDAGEVRGLRRVTTGGIGVIEVHRGAGTTVPDCTAAAATYTTYPPTCSAGNWCAFSDPRTIDITAFTLDDATFSGTVTAGTTSLALREIDINITGRLVSATDIQRSMASRVRVRADCIRATLSDCDGTPAIAP